MSDKFTFKSIGTRNKFSHHDVGSIYLMNKSTANKLFYIN